MKSLFEEIGFDRATSIMAEATAKAARRADELDLPHAVEIDGLWYYKYPSGRISPFCDQKPIATD